MELVLYVAAFGALGCLARFFLAGWIYDILGRGFPYGTFAVNVLGAYLIGLIMEMSARGTLIPPELRIGMTIGFLGGLTTFSTFSYETFKLVESGQFLAAAGNALASVFFCLLFLWGGILTARVL